MLLTKFPIAAISSIVLIGIGFLCLYIKQRNRATFVNFMWLILIAFSTTLGIIFVGGFVGSMLNKQIFGFTSDDLNILASMGAVFWLGASIYWFVQFLRGKINW
jgi:hypothetical protein